MDITKWNTEDALAVRFEEGWEKGWKEGYKEGREEGSVLAARNALAGGATVEFVQDITGLPADAVRGIQAGL
jgi:flagellar biosynthesis/type III secretory pathway protein FliH